MQCVSLYASFPENKCLGWVVNLVRTLFPFTIDHTYFIDNHSASTDSLQYKTVFGSPDPEQIQSPKAVYAGWRDQWI